MKTIIAILLVLLTCAALPIQAAEPGTRTHSEKHESGYLPNNYLFTVTVERPKKEPVVIHLLSAGRQAEAVYNSDFDPFLNIQLNPALKGNDRLVVDYKIGFRIKMEGNAFMDEGIKGSVYIQPGKEVTIFQDPGRTIKMKIALP